MRQMVTQQGAQSLVVVGASLVALAAAPDVRAQVNTENLRKKIKTNGYSWVLDGSLTGDTGNGGRRHRRRLGKLTY
jgi:hypothetical protein